MSPPLGEVLKLQGMVFDVQRFSIHDGPGIRTTVFFKGCPLSCLWCHNPESVHREPELMFRARNCIDCGKCYKACPKDALSRERPGRVDRELCDGCGLCVEVCYSEALVLAGKLWTVDEVVAESEKDRVFYENSGGGVTLSGGEPFYQPDFARAILAECKGRALHTAVETSGAIAWAILDEALPFIDHVLFDLKHIDSRRHKELVGADNELILDNARRLASRARQKAGLVFRLPVVPGSNNDEANTQGIARFITGLGQPVPLELLPYHRLAESKYAQLGRPFSLAGLKPPEKDEMSRLAARFRELGVQVIGE
ncbi:MAG: glycyl-radical enzyme activating protein [Firmicutes bacterium]|nr:glycyl-radical enzyme activating protein [Bacillota bacterium]